MRIRTLFVALAVSLLAPLTPLASVPAHAVPGEPAALGGTIALPQFGSGTGNGTMTGVYDGMWFGQVVVGAAFTASFSFNAPPATCPLTSTSVGTYTIAGAGSGVFDWIQMGATMCIWLRLPDGTYIHICGPITFQPVNPCGGATTITFAGAGGQVV